MSARPAPAAGSPAPVRLLVNEIYRSLQGESTRAGEPCTLVRLTGCGLRCRWCDTAYAFHEGTEATLEEVASRVRRLGDDLVLITGGEPLEQEGVFPLIEDLARGGSTVMVETGGHVDISRAAAASIIVLDIKTPGSGMEAHNLWANLDRLRPQDEVKLVLTDRADYLWARDLVRAPRSAGRPLTDLCTVLLSPVHGQLDPADLAAWMLEDRLVARLNLQLHKLIWPAAQRGV
jgi:7-carboxy-7-deazaguanine synthase